MQTIEEKTSKKLKKLSLKRESYFWWRNLESDEKPILVIDTDFNSRIITMHKYGYSQELKLEYINQHYPAYTLDEILAMLPAQLQTGQASLLTVYKRKTDGFYSMNYPAIIKFAHKNPAEAAAQLLIWCIEQGYVKVEEVNDDTKL